MSRRFIAFLVLTYKDSIFSSITTRRRPFVHSFVCGNRPQATHAAERHRYVGGKGPRRTLAAERHRFVGGNAS